MTRVFIFDETRACSTRVRRKVTQPGVSVARWSRPMPILIVFVTEASTPSVP